MWLNSIYEEVIFISQVLAVGLTKAGFDKNINEDSFHCMKRIYPDTLDRYELQYGKCEDHWQIYSVTDGMGGSGVGDISGRIVQDMLIQHVAELGVSDPQTFDFASFSQNYLADVNERLDERLAKYKTIDVGCSLAFVLINGSTAYTFSMGSNRIYLIRNKKLHRVTKDHSKDASDKPALYLGNLSNPRKYEPQNMNKLALEKEDSLLIVSDGIYEHLSDREILERITSKSSFVDAIKSFEEEINQVKYSDDTTILGLKVKNTEGIILARTVPESNHQPTPKEEEPIEYANPYDNPDYVYEQKGKSKLWKGLGTFFKSFGIGILIGLILLVIFWFYYFGF